MSRQIGRRLPEDMPFDAGTLELVQERIRELVEAGRTDEEICYVEYPWTNLKQSRQIWDYLRALRAVAPVSEPSAPAATSRTRPRLVPKGALEECMRAAIRELRRNTTRLTWAAVATWIAANVDAVSKSGYSPSALRANATEDGLPHPDDGFWRD